jgi:hypothetical protein
VRGLPVALLEISQRIAQGLLRIHGHDTRARITAYN